VEPDWEEAAQPAPDFEANQRVSQSARQLVSNGNSGFANAAG
jgi:hypothetical protein